MEFFESLAHSFLTAYGWEGTALAGVLLTLLGVQLYYYILSTDAFPATRTTAGRRYSTPILRCR